MKYKDLLNTNDILRLLVTRLKFTPKQMGRSIFFLCPFHPDKNPSLSFEPNRKIFTCFSCGFKANDIFNFWTKYKNPNLLNQEKLPESEIQKSLIEISKLGYFPAEKLQKITQKKAEKINKTLELFLLVNDIYQHNLLTKPGKEVLDYLKSKRQINDELINRFSLGCSISNRQITTLLFQSENHNFSSSELLSTNLVWITNNNQTCDFFSAPQLIIPLANPEGKIIAFASRKIRETSAGEGKYKYLPNYQHYYKSSLLYNYHVAKKSRVEECYLVEGFFDVISLTKSGIENCVALLGTNLSEEQIKLLSEFKKKIVLFLDGDEAGQEATINISVKLLSREIDCEVIKYGHKGDPDNICQQFDKETLHGILQKREGPYSFILNHYFTKWEVKENPQRISRLISEIAKIFQKFKINVRNFLIEKISELVKWGKEEVESYFIRRHFPVLDTRYWQITHCQEIIGNKEKKINSFCVQEWFFWLVVSEKKYFFLHKNERENYYKTYNYYTSSDSNNGLKGHYANLKNILGEESMNLPNSKVVKVIFQEIDNVKRFMLKNYGKNLILT